MEACCAEEVARRRTPPSSNVRQCGTDWRLTAAAACADEHFVLPLSHRMLQSCSSSAPKRTIPSELYPRHPHMITCMHATQHGADDLPPPSSVDCFLLSCVDVTKRRRHGILKGGTRFIFVLVLYSADTVQGGRRGRWTFPPLTEQASNSTTKLSAKQVRLSQTRLTSEWQCRAADQQTSIILGTKAG